MIMVKIIDSPLTIDSNGQKSESLSGKISPNQIFMIFKNFEWIGMIRNECEGFKMIFRKIFLWSHKLKVAQVISPEIHPCPGSTVCLSRVI